MRSLAIALNYGFYMRRKSYVGIPAYKLARKDKVGLSVSDYVISAGSYNSSASSGVSVMRTCAAALHTI